MIGIRKWSGLGRFTLYYVIDVYTYIRIFVYYYIIVLCMFWSKWYTFIADNKWLSREYINGTHFVRLFIFHHVYTHTHRFLHTHTHTLTHTHARTHARTHAHTHIHTHTYTHTHTRTHARTHTHTHTHTHTLPHSILGECSEVEYGDDCWLPWSH